ADEPLGDAALLDAGVVARVLRARLGRVAGEVADTLGAGEVGAISAGAVVVRGAGDRLLLDLGRTLVRVGLAQAIDHRHRRADLLAVPEVAVGVRVVLAAIDPGDEAL